MWRDVNIEYVGAIEKCVAEFQVWMIEILPYAKMKVKVYEGADYTYTGYTDVRIIRKFDGAPQGAVGYGKTIDEALIDTINYFVQMVKEDYPKSEYPNGLSESDIEYTEYSDF